ncbi:hypothetical protein PCANC_21694 [Puccinia coronata f. sp. avenae]|uniref:Uncharacterized protein n=1 Tax=Puccinia coronata f. sp. avenae TaxID=200324 RepID=A0A2N5U9F1_9BASI|nr:hypothetical protein PCANC_21694 [Puccinia coronata f. sp. avenae]
MRIRWDIHLFLIVSALIVVGATEYFNTSPLAPLSWDPWDENSAETLLKQDIPKLARLGWYQKPEANVPPLASEEKDSAEPPAAIDSPRDQFLSEGSVAPLKSTEDPAHAQNDTPLSLSDRSDQGKEDFLDEGNEIWSNKKNPVVTQSLKGGIFNDEMGQMHSNFYGKSIDPTSTELTSSPGTDHFDIEQLDAYLEYKKECTRSPSESSGLKLAQQGRSVRPRSYIKVCADKIEYDL